jgi:DNA-binding response OmpR family regulator
MPVETILIVEDNADIRELLTRLLEAEGYNVISAEDCAGGFEQLSKREPDLVIADVMLPDYSGLQFIRWVRERAARDKTPVIAMTAFEPGYLTAATHLGADAAIHKPEGLERLVTTVQAVLAKDERQKQSLPPREHETPPEEGYVN